MLHFPPKSTEAAPSGSVQKESHTAKMVSGCVSTWEMDGTCTRGLEVGVFLGVNIDFGTLSTSQSPRKLSMATMPDQWWIPDVLGKSSKLGPVWGSPMFVQMVSGQGNTPSTWATTFAQLVSWPRRGVPFVRGDLYRGDLEKLEVSSTTFEASPGTTHYPVPIHLWMVGWNHLTNQRVATSVS